MIGADPLGDSGDGAAEGGSNIRPAGEATEGAALEGGGEADVEADTEPEDGVEEGPMLDPEAAGGG